MVLSSCIKIKTIRDSDRGHVRPILAAGRNWENRLGELNSDLRCFPPSHAATADGCVVKHKIECIGNSDVTFHIKAGAPARQVGDCADRRPVTFASDARSIESAAGAARFIPELLLGVIHLFELPATLASHGRHRHRLRGKV
jgi:hypothetical protein